MATRIAYAPTNNDHVDEEMAESSGDEIEQHNGLYSRRAQASVVALVSVLALVGIASVSTRSHSVHRASIARDVDLQEVQTAPGGAATPPTAWQNVPAAAASQPIPPELQAAKNQLPPLSPQLNDYFNQGMGHFVQTNPCPEGEEIFSGLCYKSCASFTNGTLAHRQSAFMCCNYQGKHVGPDDDPSPSDATSDAACENGEELFSGMCYKNCADLTNGKAPLRTSAVTCCPDATGKECGLTDVKHDVGFCSGYSVSQDGKSCPHPPGKCDIKKGLHLCGGYGTGGDGKSCPHPPGDCLDNEEMHLNTCYKKCSLLTNGTKPYRMSPWTCCQSNGFSCFSPSNSDTTAQFAVSGGKDDNDASTPNQVHGALASQTS